MLLSQGRYLCWWTISPRGYRPPSSQCYYHWVDTSAGGLLVPERNTVNREILVMVLFWPILAPKYEVPKLSTPKYVTLQKLAAKI